MGGTGEHTEGWAFPRSGSALEDRGAGGQAPAATAAVAAGAEQMVEGIIKIQLCSHQRLGLKEEEAAGGGGWEWGWGCGVPKQCRVIVLYFGADFCATART